MASLLQRLDSYSKYKDRYYDGTQDDYQKDMQNSSTLYVGNLSFKTSEEQLHEVFSKVGFIKRLIMGLDRHKLTPCGFCFVEYETREGALNCMKFLNGTKIDDRPIRTDIDPGFKEGRQYGRGKSGGQVRDEVRQTFDEARGGYGAKMRGSAYDDGLVTSGAPVHFQRRGGKRRHYDDRGGHRGPHSSQPRRKFHRNNDRFRRERIHENGE